MIEKTDQQNKVLMLQEGCLSFVVLNFIFDLAACNSDLHFALLIRTIHELVE